MFHENAIEAEVNEWLNAYETDRDAAMAMLLNLVLAASGAAESLTSETAVEVDAIDKHLNGILKNFDPVKFGNVNFRTFKMDIRCFQRQKGEFIRNSKRILLVLLKK